MKPISAKRSDYSDDQLKEILISSTAKSRLVVQETLEEVKRVMGLGEGYFG